MAVSEVILQSSGAGGVEGTDKGDLRVSYSSLYRVKCDDQTNGPNTVLNFFRLNASYPWPGRTYKFGTDFDTTAVCRSVRPNIIEGSGGYFLVNCEFADVTQDQQQQSQPTIDGKQSTDPLNWLPEIDVSYGTYSMPVEYATFLQTLNGSKSAFLKENKFCAVTNSALQPLDPTFEETYSYKIIRFTKNLKEYDDNFYNQYQDAINKEETTITLRKLKFKTTVAKHHGKLNVSAALNFQNGVMYWRRTIELHIRPWDRAILDQGTGELYTAGDRLDGAIVSASDLPEGRLTFDVSIKDKDDMPIDKPVPLDGNGKRLKEGKPPVSLVWRTFDEADFSKIDW